MDLREQETAAAVQDLEIRQIELETQRKQLEQVSCCTPPASPTVPLVDYSPRGDTGLRRGGRVYIPQRRVSCVHAMFVVLRLPQELLKEQERVGREVEEEVEVRMRRDERDEEEHRHQLRDAETNLQVGALRTHARTHENTGTRLFCRCSRWDRWIKASVKCKQERCGYLNKHTHTHTHTHCTVGPGGVAGRGVPARLGRGLGEGGGPETGTAGGGWREEERAAGGGPHRDALPAGQTAPHRERHAWLEGKGGVCVCVCVCACACACVCACASGSVSVCAWDFSILLPPIPNESRYYYLTLLWVLNDSKSMLRPNSLFYCAL